MSWLARSKSNDRLAVGSSQQQVRHRLGLEALEDRWAPAILMVTNTNDTGQGSFRQAILDSNASVGVHDTIDFNIPGSGAQTITPASALPALTDSVIIDGTTQPGFAGTPLIELDGANAGSSVDGLDINAGGSTVQGLVINRFSGNGISITDSSNNLIQGNYIGTDAAGMAPLGNGSGGSLNGSNGILIVANTGQSHLNTIGGTTAAARNVISGNQGSGVEILNSGASQNLVQGNFIGIATDGQTALGNGAYGVWMSTGASNNTIGGTVAGSGNVIWFNHFFGVWVDANMGTMGIASQDGILSNSIFSNFPVGGFGTPGGIWINRPANNNQASPTLFSALPANGGGTTIKGSLQSNANMTFRIEFFANSSADPSDFGQGQTFLGFQNVTTDSTGAVSFTFVASASLPLGEPVSATATDPNNNTSKFSQDTPLLVTNTNDSGLGSLRQAMVDANAVTDVMTFIHFDIPGSGVQVIALASPLPAITGKALIIDGTSQPGYAGMPLIELDGANAGSGTDGLYLAKGTSGSSIKGLVINRFSGNGIHISVSSNNLIQGNFIGTDASGTAALGNGANGVQIDTAGSIFGPSAFNTIGGTTAGAGNVISGNQGSGMEVVGLGNGRNLVEGNFIGTGADGQTALGNAGNGVWISSAAGTNTIGGTAAGAGNIIRFNGASGVLVDNVTGARGTIAEGNGILSNSIFANGGLGITIQPQANNNQAFPILISAKPANGGGTTIQGSLHSTANTTFRIEFFVNDTPDSSGFGEGQTFLGFENVTTDANGNVSFTAQVPGTIAAGQVVSATATDPNNNTSQFSQDIPHLNPRDVAGRVNESGQWWVAQSTGSSFRNQLWGSWSTAVTWADVLRGDFTGDGRDDIAGRVAETGQWWVSLSNGSGFTNQLWTTWSTAVTWVDVRVGDFNGDGKADIAGRVLETGDWWVALSNGTGFTNEHWTTWSTAVTWKDVLVGDFNGDGRDDIAGRTVEQGAWWVANSTGSRFTNQFWGAWSTAVTWVDVRVADFNGDGFADIAGRVLEDGQWWLGVSTGSSFTNSLWTTWNPNVTWVDVKIGDFNGDGLTDIVGRVLESGQWWAAISSGSSFNNSLWTTWNPNVTWVDVQVGDFNNDGKTDITGRVLESGQWWAALSGGSQFTNHLWDTWSTSVTWVDVKAGRF